MAGMQPTRLLGIDRAPNYQGAPPAAVWKSAFRDVGCQNSSLCSAFLGFRGLRLVVVKKAEESLGGRNYKKQPYGVTQNALAVDTNPATTEHSSAWKKFRSAIGNANQTMQKVGKLNHWVVRDYDKLVNAVNSLETYMRSLSDAQLRGKTDEFRERLKKGESSLYQILSKNYANCFLRMDSP